MQARVRLKTEANYQIKYFVLQMISDLLLNQIQKNNSVCLVHTDSVEDGEKLIQSALDAFGKIGESCLFITILFLSLYSSQMFLYEIISIKRLLVFLLQFF